MIARSRAVEVGPKICTVSIDGDASGLSRNKECSTHSRCSKDMVGLAER